MCGIVGYIGSRPALPILMGGLRRLEYRGYDSAGVAFFHDGQLDVVKRKGRLSNLEAALRDSFGEDLAGGGIRLGIAHTRWATHGAPSDENSHPHLSASGRIAVVHNGIIENYLEIKRSLQDLGYRFVSETDTEVVAHLIEHHYTTDCARDLLTSVLRTLGEIEGSYALGVLCADDPDQFIAARKDSPLVVGLGDHGNFIASDIPAILEHTREVLILEDKEVAVLRADGVRVMDTLGTPVDRKPMHVDWDIESAEKGGYEHFMMKEIHEEPRAVRDTVAPRIRGGVVRLDDISLSAEEAARIQRIQIIACGTANHAGHVARYAIESLCRIPVDVDVASEFRYRDPIVDDRTLAVVISQSGETLDTMAAMREAKRRGARTFAIVNVVGSSIAREADDVLYTMAGPEIAVASTKAYNTQLAAVYLLTFRLAVLLGRMTEAECAVWTERLLALPDSLERIVSDRGILQRFAYEHFNARSVFFIGRGLDFALSMEGSLKLKEISYIHSEAYAGGELKHGTIALIEEGTLVVCPLTQLGLLDKMIGNIREVKARGAVVLGIASESTPKVDEVCDAVFRIPDVDPLLAPLLAVTPMQLFAYYVAVNKGCDVDKPRNLAKSVTVE
jgi:glutamine---fructose-6-phosphate transaminase (isomerizing)